MDDLNQTYDQMGNPDMIPRWPQERANFFDQIDRHLKFKGDFLVIDLTEFPANIREDVAKYVENLPDELFDRIIPIGF